jgi:competence protein ComEC
LRFRALLALSPALTSGFPIKKWAAAAALAAAAFYLLLSGAEVATQRSFFMTAVVLIAVMVDRRAVTFRTLAVAAMIVLVLAPEAPPVTVEAAPVASCLQFPDRRL